ncbi:unnamed protein product [Peronospora belbahrii]|uniref:WW domain-containing protein n=1 Tax=Peronospora belbahrii TaxID=622444 RepID=A0ABN8CSS5_9STRA|nr:unnamed protein product [Peronospora belbahrii]
MSDSEWEKYVDEASGSAYYYNTSTGESSWEVPAGLKPLLASDMSEDCKTTKWREFVDDASGATYYYDEVNGVSRWDKPEDSSYEENEEEAIEDQNNKQESKTQDNEKQRDESVVLEQEAQGEQNEDNGENEERDDVSSGDNKSQYNEKKAEEMQENNAARATAEQWVKYMDAASNKPYYFNASTGKTQWEEPEGFDESAQAAFLLTDHRVSAEYQAYLNMVRTKRLARVTQQVLDPSGNLSKLNTILSDIDSKAPLAAANGDGETASDASQIETAEWQQHIDAQTQRYYYHNMVTGATQWNKPDAPIVSGLANWIPPEVPESNSTGRDKTISGVNYVARAKFNRLTGKYEQLGGDDYWQNVGIASDRAGRQMSHFFDMTGLEKNREEALRRKEELKRKNIDWKKITAEKKAKKQKQRNAWLLTD